MGGCPCPRCLIPKDRTHLLGTKLDEQERTTLARVDDQIYKKDISSAREKIYQKHHPVDSVHVQRLLKPQSLVPIKVYPGSFFGSHGFNINDTEHILGKTLAFWIQFFFHLFGGFYARV